VDSVTTPTPDARTYEVLIRHPPPRPQGPAMSVVLSRGVPKACVTVGSKLL
jgi:hypothetical protein